MANVYETDQSRQASSVGTRGTNLRREFHVFIDAVTDDPIRTLNNHVAGVGYYHPHPWNRHVLAVQFSIVGDRITNWHYIVGVDYELPIGLQRDREGLEGWIVRFHGATETQALLQELLDADDNREPKLLGTPKYEPVAAVAGGGVPPTATHKIEMTGPDGAAAFTYLRRSGGIIPFPFHRNLPAVTMTLERDIPFLTLSTVGTVATFLGKVNEGRFFGADPGHLLFPTFTIQPLPIEIQQPPAAGTPTAFGPPMPWKVILPFIWYEQSRKTLELLHKHREDDGTERFVTDLAGEVVVESLQVGQSRSFDALLRLFPAARTIA